MHIMQVDGVAEHLRLSRDDNHVDLFNYRLIPAFGRALFKSLGAAIVWLEPLIIPRSNCLDRNLMLLREQE